MTGREKLPLSPNALCPCGSGKKYKNCCIDKGFKWVEDDKGVIYRSVPLPPESAAILEKHREDFVSKHGREPDPDDLLFSDLPPLEHMEAEMAEVMRVAGLPPEFVYAFEKTGLLVSEENKHLIPDVDLAAWRAAVEEFRAQGGDPWAQEDDQIAENELRSEQEGAATHALPTGDDEWLSEIAWAYRDAHEAKPFGVLTTGRSLRDDELFQLAPHMFLKARGGDLSESEHESIVESTLAGYGAAADCARGDDIETSPLLAFAFCYLAAHSVADMLDESKMMTIMNMCVRREAELKRLAGEDR